MFLVFWENIYFSKIYILNLLGSTSTLYFICYIFLYFTILCGIMGIVCVFLVSEGVCFSFQTGKCFTILSSLSYKRVESASIKYYLIFFWIDLNWFDLIHFDRIGLDWIWYKRFHIRNYLKRNESFFFTIKNN